MSSCVSPAASRWRASRRWWAVRLGGLPNARPLAFARVYTTKPLVRAPSGYATATLAPSKGRLMRCTVDGLTPNRSAMTRTPGTVLFGGRSLGSAFHRQPVHST
jgi:hypothetical protein